MRYVGIVCDTSFTRHCEFQNYAYTLHNLYTCVRDVRCVADLKGLDTLFICGDHFSTHHTIMRQKGFYKYCNDNGIQVVVLGDERIFGTVFPWNIDNFIYLSNFNHIVHYTYDVDDCKRLGTKLLRLCLSHEYKGRFTIPKKHNKIIFAGTLDGPSGTYKERKRLVNQINEIHPIDIHPTNGIKWTDYIALISKYRFVLSPLGNANALAMRFYETLLVHSIPLQQVQDNTLEYYDTEAGFEDCIFFRSTNLLMERIAKCKVEESNEEFWMEDSLGELLKEDGLL